MSRKCGDEHNVCEEGLAVFGEYKGAFKQLFLFLLLLAGIRLTGGLAVLVLAIIGFLAMGRGRVGVILVCFMYVSFALQINSTIIGSGGRFGLAARLVQLLLMAMILLLSVSRRSGDSIPIGLMYAYLMVAVVSSMQGYFPAISFLKIVNFLAFIMAVHMGTWGLARTPDEIKTLRDGIFAFALFIVLGSALTYPFPSIGYAMMVQKARMYGNQLDSADIVQNAMESGQVMLFSGVTNHSQTLAPVVVAVCMWLICDMLFVEKRVRVLHMGLIALCPVLAAMTRSRLALLGLATIGAVTCFYVLPRSHAPEHLRRKITNAFLAAMVLVVALAGVLEAKNQFISKWIRKTNNVAASADKQTMGEAFTATRQGAIASNMRDFRYNPVLGCGFQVAEQHPSLYQAGRISIFSAPIEKGLLPLMILGETGVVGAVMFGVFLLFFFTTCGRKGYAGTVAGMVLLFMLNMGEAMFFSPGGPGGAMWIVLVVGGFAADIYNKIGRRFEGWYGVPVGGWR